MKNIIKFLSIAFITILSVFAFNATVAHAEENECDICHEYANEFVSNEQDIYSRSFERNHATIVDYEAALELVNNEYNFYYNAYNHIEKDHTTATTEEETTTATTTITSDEPETTTEELVIILDEPEETTSEVTTEEPARAVTTTTEKQTTPTTTSEVTTTKKAPTTTVATTTTPTEKTTTSVTKKTTDNISHNDIEFHGINCSICYELANQFVSNEQDIYSRSFERNHATIVDYKAALELVNNEFEYYYAINNHCKKE